MRACLPFQILTHVPWPVDIDQAQHVARRSHTSLCKSIVVLSPASPHSIEREARVNRTCSYTRRVLRATGSSSSTTTTTAAATTATTTTPWSAHHSRVQHLGFISAEHGPAVPPTHPRELATILHDRLIKPKQRRGRRGESRSVGRPWSDTCALHPVALAVTAHPDGLKPRLPAERRPAAWLPSALQHPRIAPHV